MTFSPLQCSGISASAQIQIKPFNVSRVDDIRDHSGQAALLSLTQSNNLGLGWIMLCCMRSKNEAT